MSMVEAIRRMVKDMTKPDIILGTVTDFDSTNWLATVKINNGAEIDEVRIKSVVNSEESGIFIEPVIGSYVLLGMIEGKIASLFIVAFSEIVKYHLKTDLIEFNGDTFGGIVKSQMVHSEIEDLKNDINSLKQAFASWVTVPNDGGAALKVATGAWFAQPLIVPIQTDFENDKVKHG